MIILRYTVQFTDKRKSAVSKVEYMCNESLARRLKVLVGRYSDGVLHASKEDESMPYPLNTEVLC